MNATGTNTAHRTRPMATTGPDTSFIASRVASTGFLAVLEVMLHRLDHHDGVVHHDADGQHQAEHRQHVHAEAQHREHDERAQQRDGHRAHRDDRGAEALQEDIDHDQHQHDRLEQRMHDLLHRGFDRQGGIERDVVSHVRREPRLGVLENLLHVVRGLDGVGARREEDADGARRGLFPWLVEAARASRRSARPVPRGRRP